MLMNRTFLLACATVVTLGITAASSTPAHARRCSDAIPTARKRRAISGAPYIKPKLRRRRREPGQQQMKGSSRPATGATGRRISRNKTKCSLVSRSCGLTKEYVNGAVKFRDTCTGEWAERDN